MGVHQENERREIDVDVEHLEQSGIDGQNQMSGSLGVCSYISSYESDLL